MVNLTIPNVQELLDKHFKKLYNEDYNGNAFSIKKRLEKTTEKYKKTYTGKLFFYLKNNIKKVLTGTPEELEEIKDYIENRHFLCMSPSVIKDLNKIFNYTGFSQRHGINKYSVYNLEKNLNINTCPYCNRNYIFPAKYHRTSELDHFFPQSKYPYLALSFFNLIPSCKVCNKLKLATEILINPYDKRYHNNVNFEFRFKPLNTSYKFRKNAFKLQILYKNFEVEYKKNFEVFRIFELYIRHKDIILELIQKREIYSDEYIEDLVTAYPQLFHSRREILKLITCIDIDEAETLKRPISKLTQDIAKQLGFT